MFFMPGTHRYEINGFGMKELQEKTGRKKGKEGGKEKSSTPVSFAYFSYFPFSGEDLPI